MSIKSPSRRWGALLAGSAIVLSTAVVGLTGVAQAEPEPTASECTTEPTDTSQPTTTAPTTTAAETTAAETTGAETTAAETTAAETTAATTTAAETTAAEGDPLAEGGEGIPGGAQYAFGASIAQALTVFVEETTCEPGGGETTEPTTTAPTTTAPTTTAPADEDEETTEPTTSAPTTSNPSTSAPTQTTQPEKATVPAVRDIKASVGTSSILVTWNAPVDSSSVVAYQAFANPVGAQSSGEMVACFVAADARSCRLGVEAGRAYLVGVFGIDKDKETGEAGDFVTTTVVPAPATAATPPAGNTSLKKADGSAISNVTAGQKMTLRGEGYLPFSTVALYVYSTPTFLGNVTADKDGRFTVDVTIPASLANGEHSLVASGVDFNGNSYVMRSDFTVGAAGAQQAKLPFTGASVALPLLGGLVAVGVGGGLLVAARRRSNA